MGKPRTSKLSPSDDYEYPKIIPCISIEPLSCKYEAAMPGLIKRLNIVAGLEGLTLQPTTQRIQRSLQINYTTLEISSLAHSKRSEFFPSAEVYGIVEVHGIVGS